MAPFRDDRELMQAQLEVLYQYDQQDRMLRINEPNGGNAPMFAMGRSRHGNLWRFRADLPDSLVSDLDAICQREPLSSDLHVPAACYNELIDRISSFARPRSIWRGPCYVFEEPIVPPAEPIGLTADTISLLEEHLLDWCDLSLDSAPYVILNSGSAVAICYSSRIGPRVCEAGVETAPAYRNRGYARAVVRAWAAAIQASGRTPLYSTSWMNRASQALANAIGLRLYGENLSIAS
jgi:RimJ/RimL family protein N-acetyltransferase